MPLFRHSLWYDFQHNTIYHIIFTNPILFANNMPLSRNNMVLL